MLNIYGWAQKTLFYSLYATVHFMHIALHYNNMHLASSLSVNDHRFWVVSQVLESDSGQEDSEMMWHPHKPVL